jgi:hypothetical protein
MSEQDTWDTESLNGILSQIFKADLPPRVTCANHCDHGCFVQPEPDEHWMTAALREGWTIVRWNTSGNAGHDNHVVPFCDPGCAYQWMRARMLADPHWILELDRLDEQAMTNAEEMIEHMHPHHDHDGEN